MENTERKSLSKKIRYEVLKRDKFTCQYCGRMAPDVILEIDHIIPVAEGGANDLLNLVTACRDCNRGKGKTRLSDDTVLKKQQSELLDMSTRLEQQEMMAEWKLELANKINDFAERVSEYIEEKTGIGLNEHGLQDIRKLIRQFSYPEVIDSVIIAYDTYYCSRDKSSWHEAFYKIGGICYNRKHDIKGW